MKRKNFCKACSNEKFGVKTRVAVEHTCGEDGPREPETVHGNEAGKRDCPACGSRNVKPAMKSGHFYCADCMCEA